MKNNYWQDIEKKELDSAELKGEFREGELDHYMNGDKTRRNFLKMMGYSFAAVPLASSCIRIPVKKALPFLYKNDTIVPGVATWFATAMDPSFGSSLLVKTREGRPIKIEGNAFSSITMGGTSPIDQASVLSLYDSYRYRKPQIDKADVSYESIDSKLKQVLNDLKSSDKEIVFVTRTVSSPSTLRLINEIKSQYSNFKHVVYEPFAQTALLNAVENVYGSRVYPSFRFDKADKIVSFSADFLGTWLQPVQFTKQYTSRRDLSVNKELNKLFVYESYMSLTGSNADFRKTVSPNEEKKIIFDLFAILKGESSSGKHEDAKLLASELRGNHSLVVSGIQDVAVQEAVIGINQLLGNENRSIFVYENPHFMGADDTSFSQLLGRMEKGKVGAVILWDCNPAYDYINSDKFKAAYSKVSVRVSLALAPDETSVLSNFVYPTSYFLESWNDYFQAPAQISYCQPVIQPLYGSRMAQESLMTLFSVKGRYYDYVKETSSKVFLSQQSKYIDAISFWDACVHNGVYDLNNKPKLLNVNLAACSKHLDSFKNFKMDYPYVIPYEKISMRQGQFINNPWLQEMPDPITKVTWENYAMVSSAFAKDNKLKTGDFVKLSSEAFSVELPVVVQPGMDTNAIAVAIGYGRTESGKVGKNCGANAFGFKSFEKIQVSKLAKSQVMAQTQTHHSMEGRAIVKETTLNEYLSDPKSGNKDGVHIFSLWNGHEKKGQQWAMAIDLNKCTGCTGCVVSCNAENNVPVVGKDEVANRREMHWLRIDRYYKGDDNNPEVVHQPVMCQHCDNAPCETVCPVIATAQSSDGLNQQVYNRCVGTRYCANNCPYKVRRFNWFDYPHNDMNENMVLNPDVVVRSRGVMEKCSMCIQRIQEARLQAKKEGREVLDGEIKLACQQSCPGDAIVFGDINDPNSKVSKLLNHPRNYRLLEELNIQPRVNYLTKVRNKE